MFQKIPEEFYAFDSKQPFKSCIECEKQLDSKTPYMIEKAMRRYPGFDAIDTLFDYAICMNCAMEMRNSLSSLSKQQMDQFFMEHMSNIKSPRNEDGTLDVNGCLNSCLVTGKPVDEFKEYQIYAFCQGDKLSDQVPPYMVSEEAVEMLLPLLSSETTDFLDGFFNKHFSPDPSLMEPIGPKLILV